MLGGMSRLKDVCIDCGDPWKLAHWWAPVVGYVVRPHSEEDLASLRRGYYPPHVRAAALLWPSCSHRTSPPRA